MSAIIAAIRTGRDPVGRLPEAAFHRTLDQQLVCPRCSATYNLVVDFNAAVGRFFEEESRRPIMMLRKAIHLDHASGHRTIHFETAGVVVTSFRPDPKPGAPRPEPRPELRPDGRPELRPKSRRVP